MRAGTRSGRPPSPSRSPHRSTIMGASSDGLAGGRREERVGEKTHAEALRIAQSGYAAFSLAMIERPESARWDLRCATATGSATARVMPETQGRPRSVYGRRPASTNFPSSRPTARMGRAIDDSATSWGFAKSNPLDLLPLPGNPVWDDTPWDDGLQRSSSQFAKRSRERMARKQARLEKSWRMERAMAEQNADLVRVSPGWWLCCCFLRASERQRTGRCMPKTGPEAEAARKQRMQTAMEEAERRAL